MRFNLKRLFGIKDREGKIDKEVVPLAYRETGAVKIGYPVLRGLLGPLVKGIWIEEIEGLENIPKEGPAIIASNHQSYFDFLCFTAVCPRKVHYLAAEKFYKSNMWRPIMNLTGQIKVERESHDKTGVYEAVYSALNQGMLIGIFPEGTRSGDGEIQKPFTGVAKFALTANVPILPVGIIGTYDIMSRNNKRPNFRAKAKIKIGEPMYFTGYSNPTDNDYRLVTDTVMKRIADLAGKQYKFGGDYEIKTG
ncbi:MAG: hypothetical protein A2365_00845 [Candidatus Nealsonbacteria bacterium RIFOXYB1_FULL_40_15]|uniref:Phospholipid/glycerol acyltransferase domain-containing protein n=2 Tax=Candidatus Nealsoniibacteriota TaxID=1817911 RepID=A0A1G2EQN2_9BACT|nr:MAG: hypothetical protein A2365_00845 [Candidatus Nealsonbacteria bacterium RIFOXYB1_FULL_40_15]OGZ28069.1 MAG: hypothetical protein A2427_03325 [Candidatus Nealsonbacteria bacterium RIFOXYC1_FULL_40_7]OGZ28530.1 MAG: hypothetical protein A2562_03535 [Candidatus Nealsonbacteria bacterium RIFOXYD1_FULL_39_11]